MFNFVMFVLLVLICCLLRDSFEFVDPHGQHEDNVGMFVPYHPDYSFHTFSSHRKVPHLSVSRPEKLIRHSTKVLDKFFDDRGVNLSDSLSLSELIWSLRGLRSRRRRSSSTLDSKKFNGTWPLRRLAEIEGNVVLGGLMMVHEREDSITCGPIMPQGGIQALETMLYTVDHINGNEFLPGIRLGVHILDDCDKDTYGLEQAVDFIKGSISNIDDGDFGAKCPDGSSPGAMRNKVISGVVGASSSVTSIQVANLLRLFKIPQVSFFSTSPELSNKQRFEYFARTIPSDKYQVKAMVTIIKKFKWSYVSIVYEESNYGIKAFEELETSLAESSICIAAKEKLVKDSGVAQDEAYDRIVERLLAARAKGVIIFGSDQEVKGLMVAVKKKRAAGYFTWIGSDGWSARTLVSDGNEAEVDGTLSVQPRANPVKGFDHYFFSLNIRNNARNPWFIEFWEHHFGCKYPNSSRTPYNIGYNRTCSGDEKLTPENTQFEAQLQYVSDAVMAFAYALKDMQKTLCNGTQGLCDNMDPIEGIELLKYLQKVKFVGLSGDDFHFDSAGDGPARYNIIHFRKTEAGNYAWVRVGEYNEGELSLNMSLVRFADGRDEAPVSVCSDSCGEGEAKRFVGGDTCCWSCIECTNDQIRHPDDESSCFTCKLGTLPDETHTRCNNIPEEYLEPSSGWAIGAMAFAGIGILLTVFVTGVFIQFSGTPVVRASGRELSFVLLAALFSCYSLTFIYVLKPNDVICGIQQFGTGFAFTTVYAALLTKTNRIARIFQAGRKSARRPSFISPRSQILICAALVLVQVIVIVVWMLLQPPKAIHHYPTREDNLLVCHSYINASYTIAFAYPLTLIVVCTVYAVLTRKIPEAFNESKYIGFTMYTTCIIWLAFVPIYFSTANQVALRITSMTVAISLSATVMIVCLFFPKLYIILVHPERNVRQSMMTAAKHSSAHPPTQLQSSTTLAPPPNIQMTSFSSKENHVDAPKPKIDSGTQSDGREKVCASVCTQTEDFTELSSTANENSPKNRNNLSLNLKDVSEPRVKVSLNQVISSLSNSSREQDYDFTTTPEGYL